MEPLTETISLDLEESNDLAFKIKLEGAASSPAKVRLVCEGEDVAYMFNGYGTGEPEVVQFTLPQMKNKLKEGTYSARIEVLVENRYFAPLQFQINFKKPFSVVAEAIQIVQKVLKPEISVSASPVLQPKTSQAQTLSTIQFEQRPQAPRVVEQAVSEATPATNIANSKAASLKESYNKKTSPTHISEDAQSKTPRTTLRDKLKK